MTDHYPTATVAAQPGQFPVAPVPVRHYAILASSFNQSEVCDFFARHMNMTEHRLVFTTTQVALEYGANLDDGTIDWQPLLTCGFGNIIVAMQGVLWAVEIREFEEHYRVLGPGPAWPEDVESL